MEIVTRINADVSVGGQPAKDEFPKLRQQGYQSVVNFRHDGEDHQPLTPAAEAQEVELAGMKYLHHPVSMKTLTPEQVDEFRAQYATLPKPIFAHCKSGTRAGAMMLMHAAVERNITGDDALQEAKRQGFDFKPELQDFVKSYVNSRRTQQ